MKYILPISKFYASAMRNSPKRFIVPACKFLALIGDVTIVSDYCYEVVVGADELPALKCVYLFETEDDASAAIGEIADSILSVPGNIIESLDENYNWGAVDVPRGVYEKLRGEVAALKTVANPTRYEVWLIEHGEYLLNTLTIIELIILE